MVVRCHRWLTSVRNTTSTSSSARAARSPPSGRSPAARRATLANRRCATYRASRSASILPATSRKPPTAASSNASPVRPLSSASRSTRKLARSNSGSPHAKRSKSTSPSRPVSSTSHCPGCAAPWTGTRRARSQAVVEAGEHRQPSLQPARQGGGRRGSPGQGPLGPPQLVRRVVGVGGGERGHGELAERDPDLSSEPEALGAEQAWLQRFARHDAVPARPRPLVPTLRFGHGEREGSGGRRPSNGHVPPAGRRSPWRTPSRTGPRARVRRARCSGCRGGSARPSDPPVPRAPSAVPAAPGPARRARSRRRRGHRRAQAVLGR